MPAISAAVAATWSAANKSQRNAGGSAFGRCNALARRGPAVPSPQDRRQTVKTKKPTTLELLEKHGACPEATEWAKPFKSPSNAWKKCKNPQWMLWALSKLGKLDEKRARLFAVKCIRETPLNDGRVVLDLLTDQRSRDAVDVAERFANGAATESELLAARSAAQSAAWSDAWSATRLAAWSATRLAARSATM